MLCSICQCSPNVGFDSDPHPRSYVEHPTAHPCPFPILYISKFCTHDLFCLWKISGIPFRFIICIRQCAKFQASRFNAVVYQCQKSHSDLWFEMKLMFSEILKCVPRAPAQECQTRNGIIKYMQYVGAGVWHVMGIQINAIIEWKMYMVMNSNLMKPSPSPLHVHVTIFKKLCV